MGNWMGTHISRRVFSMHNAQKFANTTQPPRRLCASAAACCCVMTCVHITHTDAAAAAAPQAHTHNTTARHMLDESIPTNADEQHIVELARTCHTEKLRKHIANNTVVGRRRRRWRRRDAVASQSDREQSPTRGRVSRSVCVCVSVCVYLVHLLLMCV